MTVVIDELGEGHAVLTVCTDRGDYILDNKTSAILPADQTGYVFVKRESQDVVVWVSLEVAGNNSYDDCELAVSDSRYRTRESAFNRAAPPRLAIAAAVIASCFFRQGNGPMINRPAHSSARARSCVIGDDFRRRRRICATSSTSRPDMRLQKHAGTRVVRHYEVKRPALNRGRPRSVLRTMMRGAENTTTGTLARAGAPRREGGGSWPSAPSSARRRWRGNPRRQKPRPRAWKASMAEGSSDMAELPIFERFRLTINETLRRIAGDG